MSKAEAEPDVKSIEVAPGQTLHLRCDWGVGIGGGLWTTGEHLCAHFREPALSYARWLDGAISSLYSDAAAFPAAFHDKNPLAAALNLTASFVRSLDSIQRLWHKEGWALS